MKTNSPLHQMLIHTNPTIWKKGAKNSKPFSRKQLLAPLLFPSSFHKKNALPFFEGVEVVQVACASIGDKQLKDRSQVVVPFAH